MTHLIAPSLLSADFANLQRDIEMLNQSNADWFHVDIMDGNFVPNLSIGFPVLKAIATYARKPLDIHLMIQNPDFYIERFCVEAKASILTVHYEACTHLHRTLRSIKKMNVKTGVSLNPHTPVDVLEDIICEADLILLMSVNPGFGGQKFIQQTYHKIQKLKAMIQAQNLNTLIEVDGGVDVINYKQLLESGVDVLVCGNAVFSSENPRETINLLKQ
ncbi:MAG: ribulose-phosphate 3-epimerase [Bacteroidales bacterium]|jgi:ribulose-phosphate 3-epimerase|nr:ribulose-phosphate 3-epimerase [Bacteroidales bacterium]MDD3330007.1 ribulose-phosphate 3-epimerase [Bacteroidales bacterium]MDD3690644.1 ribulose-phosphate 3-epimerase [Bacteroidales bacterium]MDD4043856.1 ribulose-phosphate 3-epimerase [Bacteroidales bacterium]MDD4580818.1 ribulose-phosphate 3-epimerase [Bacteroidales bacterium]